MSKQNAVSVPFGPTSKKQQMIMDCEAQILIMGGAAGSGKSYLLQMLPLKFMDDPKANAIIFRRTTVQIKGLGGVFDTARGMYMQLPDRLKPRMSDHALEAKFPTGFKLKWSHMEREVDKFNHQGLQYTFIGFDEGTQFDWSQIEYLMSRMRSESKYPSRMVISCNPDPDHKIAEMISWWLDEDGYPIEERAGVIRYFILKEGQYLWGDTKEELIARHGENVKPISFSFIGSTIKDNPLMLANNKDYLAWLEGLNPIDKARLLDGNWKVRPLNSMYFRRDWCAFADAIPMNSFMVRAYDKAGTAPSDKDPQPDFTAQIGMAKSKDGYYYIFGNYHPQFKDEDSKVLGVLRKTVGERDMLIEKQARQDGTDVTIVFPKDPSAAGKYEFIESAKKLQNQGFTVKADPMPQNKSKLTRFSPFAAAAENGLVKIVISSFDKSTLDYLFKCLEQFTGERSTKTYKDDLPDCVASAFNMLNTVKVYTTPNLSALPPPPLSTKAIALSDL